MSRLRILLVDDHPLFRGGVKQALETDDEIVVVAEAGTMADAKRVVEKRAYDVAIVDITLPDGTGLELLAWLQTRDPGSRNVMMSVHCSFEFVHAAFRAGARGYLTKGTPAEELRQAVRIVHDGGVYASAEAADYLSGDPAEHRSSLADQLTERELEVALVLSAGKKTVEVAADLGVSPKTIEAHRANIYRKLGFRNIAQLTRAVAEFESRR
ncbi:MAG: response regulator [Spirochaetota bacterium]